jgi:phosphoglycolate phosphatase-like HAD superfamily hydrolase
MNQKELAATFRKLGAQDPEDWARSQVEEGLPQLARFLFLRQAWRQIVQEADSSWIDASIDRAKTHPDEPYAGVGHALRKLRARGATNEELTDVVRGMQAQLLFSFCYLLEDPGDVEPEAGDIGWVLAQVDQEGNVLDTIGGLHESVLETDPTGREMRPRDADAG